MWVGTVCYRRVSREESEMTTAMDRLRRKSNRFSVRSWTPLSWPVRKIGNRLTIRERVIHTGEKPIFHSIRTTVFHLMDTPTFRTKNHLVILILTIKHPYEILLILITLHLLQEVPPWLRCFLLLKRHKIMTSTNDRQVS